MTLESFIRDTYTTFPLLNWWILFFCAYAYYYNSCVEVKYVSRPSDIPDEDRPKICLWKERRFGE